MTVAGTWSVSKFTPSGPASSKRMGAAARRRRAACPTITSIASSASARVCTSRPRAASSIAPTIAARTGARLPSPYEGSFFGLVPIRGEGLLAFGLRGHLYRSADAGETWHELQSHTTAMLTDGVAINDLRVVVVGLAGVLLVSSDAGETFKLTQQDDRKGISAILPGPAGSMVVAGEGGVRIDSRGLR